MVPSENSVSISDLTLYQSMKLLKKNCKHTVLIIIIAQESPFSDIGTSVRFCGAPEGSREIYYCVPSKYYCVPS